jgi:hypothetical protein
MERSIEDVRAIFAKIDRLGGVSFLPDGRPKQPPMPTRPAVSFDAGIDFIEEKESGPGVRRAGADPLG